MFLGEPIITTYNNSNINIFSILLVDRHSVQYVYMRKARCISGVESMDIWVRIGVVLLLVAGLTLPAGAFTADRLDMSIDENGAAISPSTTPPRGLNG